MFGVFLLIFFQIFYDHHQTDIYDHNFTIWCWSSKNLIIDVHSWQPHDWGVVLITARADSCCLRGGSPRCCGRFAVNSPQARHEGLRGFPWICFSMAGNHRPRGWCAGLMCFDAIQLRIKIKMFWYVLICFDDQLVNINKVQWSWAYRKLGQFLCCLCWAIHWRQGRALMTRVVLPSTISDPEEILDS